MAATLADVAEKAGVSRAAVSRTFTPGASVSAAMRARVEAAAEALGYSPNMLRHWVRQALGVRFEATAGQATTGTIGGQTAI